MLQPQLGGVDDSGMLFIAVGTLLITLSVALLAWSLPKVPLGGE